METSKNRAPAVFLGMMIFLAYSSARSAVASPIQTSRGACEAALALESSGQQTPSSRGPCHSAFLVGGALEDMRNEVASLMSPRAFPSLDDLVVATLISDAAVRKAADQPWGYLARCDIARRLGSADVLETCLADLRRGAAAHPEAKRALAYGTERASFGIWALRVVFLLGLLGTLADALFRRKRRAAGRLPGPAKPVVLLVAVCALAGGWGARIARAEGLPIKEQLSQLKIDDADPEASVPSLEMQNKRPLEFGYYIQDLAAKAEKATQRGDHASAARFYLALTEAIPTSSVGPRKMCQSLEAAGEAAKAIVACRTVLTRDGATAGDTLRFVHLVLATKGPLSAGERAELDAVITHLGQEAKLGAVPVMLRCEVALRFADTPALAACTDVLSQIAPNDPKTVSFQWALALRQHDRSAALELVDRARGVGMSKDGVAQMEEATRQMGRHRLERFALLALGAALAAALLALGFRHRVQRRRVAV